MYMFLSMFRLSIYANAAKYSHNHMGASTFNNFFIYLLRLLVPLPNPDSPYEKVTRAVLPNLCAAAHKCAARAVQVCRGRMSEINSLHREVSMTFSTLIKNV